MRGSFGRSGLLCAGLLLLASTAHAGDDEKSAAALDRAARAAFQRKDFAAAARAFERAFELEPHPATEYNAALAWDEAHERARAADAFEAALALPGLDAERTKASRERLAALGRQLATVTITRPIGGTVTVAQLVRAPIPARAHLAPGAYTLLIRTRAGRELTRDVTLKAGEVASLEVADDAPEKAPPQRSLPERPEPVATPPASEPPGRSYLAPGIAFGAAAVFTGAAAYLGVRTLSVRDDYVDNHPGSAEKHDEAVRLRTFTNLAWSAAAVCAGVGTALLVWGGPSEDAKSHAAIGIGPGSVQARLRF